MFFFLIIILIASVRFSSFSVLYDDEEDWLPVTSCVISCEKSPRAKLDQRLHLSKMADAQGGGGSQGEILLQCFFKRNTETL